MKILRKNNGSALSLGVSLALVLVVLGLGFLAFVMYMGGQNETVNAVDAGALNVGRQILDDKSKIAVQLDLSPSQQCFHDVTTDCADVNAYSDPSKHPGGVPSPDNNVTLRRINRVWGEAMLMAINADASKTGSMVSNAESAFGGAQEISNKLQANLSKQSNLEPFFTSIANQNSMRMLGKNSTITPVPGANWQTSFMDKAVESNITLSGSSPNFNMPPGYNFSSNFVTQTKRKVEGGGNLWFLKGYTPIKIGDNTFWQVPFQYDEKPHLVAQQDFTSSQKQNGWNDAVPNAFSVEGKGGTANAVQETGIARVLTNPREPFQLSIPHGFIHVKVDQMKSHWYFFPPIPIVPFEFEAAQEDYGFTPDYQSGAPCPGGGICCTSVIPSDIVVGSEVAFADLGRDIYDYPITDTSTVDATLVNRVNEMITLPGKVLTAGDVHNCLSDGRNIPFLVADVKDFYIFSPDGQSIECLPMPLCLKDAPWLALAVSNDPDGENGKISSDVDDQPGMITLPPTPIPAFGCSPLPPPAQMEWSTVHKEVYWQPGTGYNSNLGQLEIKRWTNVYSLGICNPL